MFTQPPYSTSSCTSYIQVKALQDNYTTLCSRIPATAQGMAIIKNDAYGHGLLPVAKALDAVGAPCFGVGTADEGRALREAGFTQEILILLGACTPEEMALCAQYKLTVHIHSRPSLDLAVRTASADTPLRVAIKCETGMARLGFLPEDMPHVLEVLQKAPHVQAVMVSTHISCADMPEKESMVRAQMHTFARMTQELVAAYPHIQRSLCNSAASLAYADLAAELGATVYRFGIALYGGNPFSGTPWQAKGQGLREGMRIGARILHVYDAKAGQSIGYGASYVAEKDMRIAVVGIGYADGFTRGLSSPSQARVSVHGKPAKVCGRVCMGAIMVDVSGIAQAQEGDMAWVVDASLSDGAFSMQALAEAWGTIPYECFCLLGKNTRIYE